MQDFASYETPKTSTTSSSSSSNGDSKLTTKKHTVFLFCPLLPSNSQQHKTMLKLLSSTSRQIQTHLTSPCLRVTTESQPSSFVNSLSSLTGLAQRNHKSLSFYQEPSFSLVLLPAMAAMEVGLLRWRSGVVPARQRLKLVLRMLVIPRLLCLLILDQRII
ncbi:hypothetical protein BDE02_06G240500 [Populus trichocarpa]|nr:hypothetical protein BDE02_06G240500 [Populus trichocarpa]